MFVTKQDIFALNVLSTTKNLVNVDTIPAVFIQDFQIYFYGKTLVKKDDALLAYPHDIKAWVQFMYYKYS
ncbi:hypothetical protein [Flavobacterium sp. NKUCC04_CG]|uniref:hypothetical protein n=1 Tax=Flavobacterium sp. NKUCC04_CG TaxID=2842121 RepID=UPI001C5AAB1A|nr:hypothetical protein [Flavobacterium sp. NKUCC04_CG]MBW3519510.1 hypothetical protein [Flavobacterium sp. NKUCC04_CG]